MPTDDSSLLVLIAEVSVAFIGFSMVVGVLRTDENHGRLRIESMRAVAETALIAGGGALLALTLGTLDLASETVWRIASIVVAVAWTSGFVYATQRFRRAESPLAPNTLEAVVMSTILAAAIGLLLWNVISPTGIAGGRYATALTLALVISAKRFVYANFGIGDGTNQ